MRKTILVTGASGFVGRLLCETLAKDGYRVLGIGRSAASSSPVSFSYRTLDLETDELDHSLLDGVDCVIHLAGQAHSKGGAHRQVLEGFRSANVFPTVRLAKLAISSRVERFIFVSSIGVYGAYTNGHAISENTGFNPKSLYASSKLEAERQLVNLFEQSSCSDLVVVRPPLVYGDGAPGNLASLMSLAKSGIPLPFGSCRNRRSLVSRKNLVEFIELCIHHQRAGNTSFVVADGDSVSTKQLVTALRNGMGIAPRLLPFPPTLMKGLLNLIGKSDVYDQLYCDLDINSNKAEEVLNWRPNRNTLEELKEMGARYVDSRN